AFPGDTETYARYGRALVNDGRIPYHDFYDEYPPGSVPVFAAPAAIWDAHYVLVFKLLMAACGLGCVACSAWIVQRLRLSPWRLGPLVLAPVLMGPVFLNRYDPLPAFLTSLALVALLRARTVTTGALLGADTAIKVYSVVTLPLAWRRLRARRRPVLAGAGHRCAPRHRLGRCGDCVDGVREGALAAVHDVARPARAAGRRAARTAGRRGLPRRADADPGRVLRRRPRAARPGPGRLGAPAPERTARAEP